jgi:hypothetical protein
VGIVGGNPKDGNLAREFLRKGWKLWEGILRKEGVGKLSKTKSMGIVK